MQPTDENEWLPGPARGWQVPGERGEGGARTAAKKTINQEVKGKENVKVSAVLSSLQTMHKNRTNNPVHKAVVGVYIPFLLHLNKYYKVDGLIDTYFIQLIYKLVYQVHT